MKDRPIYLQRGFTLIELLVVVAIIAIISAVAVPQMLRALNLSKDKRAMSEIRNLAIAIGVYSIEYEIVPQTSDIQVLITALKNVQDNSKLPLNVRDAWGHDYYYRSPSLTEYTLKSLGRDGTEGTPATSEYFDADADIVVISGTFRASHQGTTSIVGH